MGAEVLDRPVGIVFHTSESDIWPLEESFNEKLRDSSLNLLRYLKKNRVYHYLIDRFGRVFRVVEETDKANHAGMSVWSAGSRVYLNLNGPTIGVSSRPAGKAAGRCRSPGRSSRRGAASPTTSGTSGRSRPGCA